MKEIDAKAGEAMPPGRNAADYVIILPDWDGAVPRQYGRRSGERNAVARPHRRRWNRARRPQGARVGTGSAGDVCSTGKRLCAKSIIHTAVI